MASSLVKLLHTKYEISTNQARDEYLTALFINNCDPTHHAECVTKVKVSHIEGHGDSFMSTLIREIKMLETVEEVYNSIKVKQS